MVATINGLFRFGLYALLILAPLPLGSNRPIFWGINGVISAFVVGGFVWSEVKTKSSRFDWHIPLVAISALLLIALWIFIQASSWTPKAWHHPVWFVSPMVAGAASSISADPSQTWQALSWWSTLSIFIVAVRWGTNSKRNTTPLRLMLLVCIFVALFGFIVEFFHLNTLGLITKTYYSGWLTGTFVNRNSAASFIGIGMIISFALAQHEFSVRNSGRPNFSVFDIVDFAISRAAAYTVAGLLLFFALLLTGSRAGIAAGIFGSSLVLLAHLLKNHGLNRRVAIAFMSGLMLSIALAAVALQFRTATSESNEIRVSLYKEALRAIAERPILGHGAGAFESIQPIYHSASTPSNVVWNNAHSTVLEVMVTLGIPATLFGATVLAYSLVKLAGGWWSSPKEGICTTVALAASAAVFLHAFVDFSLEIQAIALYVACLLGLGMGEVMYLNRDFSAKGSAG
jgi:O-antigen ligase